MLDKAAEEGKGGGPASRASPVACWRPPFLASGAPGDSRCPCGPMEKQVLGRLERFATTLPMQARGRRQGRQLSPPLSGQLPEQERPCSNSCFPVCVPQSVPCLPLLSVRLSLEISRGRQKPRSPLTVSLLSIVNQDNLRVEGLTSVNVIKEGKLSGQVLRVAPCVSRRSWLFRNLESRNRRSQPPANVQRGAAPVSCSRSGLGSRPSREGLTPRWML